MASSKNAAAARRDEIIAENINFMYGRSKENAAADSDKRSFVKSNRFVDPFDTISDFSGDKSFLLPSFACEVFISGEGDAYPSYEHALQASRFSHLEERKLIRETPLIRDVKKMTPKFLSNRGEQWKKECLSVAEKLLRDKFIRSKEMTSQLRETGKKSLVYANSYGEHFWGSPVDNNLKGQNHLGKLLEKIRSDIVKGEDIDLWLTSQIKIVEQEKVEIDMKVEKAGAVLATDSMVFERRPKLFLGKAELNDIVTAHNSTSRTHAAVVVGTLLASAGVQAFLVDFRSANGSFINGTKILPYIFMAITGDSLVTVGASARGYRFTVDTKRDQRAREFLYNKLANPDILTAKAEEEKQENTVFVGNIAFEATEADVKEFFESCGEVLSIVMPKDKDKPADHRGIAFVTFTATAGLVQALSRGGDELLGRNVAVKRRESSKTAKSVAPKKQDESTYYNNMGKDKRDRDDKEPAREKIASSSSGDVSRMQQTTVIDDIREAAKAPDGEGNNDPNGDRQQRDNWDRKGDRDIGNSRDNRHDRDNRDNYSTRKRQRSESPQRDGRGDRDRDRDDRRRDGSRNRDRRRVDSRDRGGGGRDSDDRRGKESSRRGDRGGDRDSDNRRDRDRGSDGGRDRDGGRDKNRDRDRDHKYNHRSHSKDRGHSRDRSSRHRRSAERQSDWRAKDEETRSAGADRETRTADRKESHNDTKKSSADKEESSDSGSSSDDSSPEE